MNSGRGAISAPRSPQSKKRHRLGTKLHAQLCGKSSSDSLKP